MPIGQRALSRSDAPGIRPRFELPVEDGAPPSEFRIFRSGLNQTIKGDFLFDAESARKVMSRFEDMGNELVIDYEHQTTVDPPIKAPAAGWFMPELRDGELWARVKWTDVAAEHIKQKEYRYFSPWFDVDERGRVTWLRNVALTNFPATKNLTPLVAAKADGDGSIEQTAAAPIATAPEKRGANMNEEQKAAMIEEMKKLAAAVEAGDMGAVAECLGKLAGMAGVGASAQSAPETATAPADPAAASVAARASDLAQQVIALTGKTEGAEVVGTLNAWKQASVALSAAQTELGKLRSKQREAEFEQVIADGKRAGKLTPGMVDSAWIKGLRGKESGVIELRAFLEAAPQVVSTETAGEPGAGGTTVALTAEEAKIAQIVGVKPDVALKAKQERMLRAAK